MQLRLLFSALFGVLFSEKQEAAFASYRMLQAVGLAMAFGYSYLLCIQTKLYIMGSFMAVGLLLYGVIEYKLYLNKKYVDGVVVLWPLFDTVYVVEPQVEVTSELTKFKGLQHI